MKTRNQIEEKYKWDLTSFGVNDENFIDKCKTLQNFQEKIYALEGKIKSDDDILNMLKLFRQHTMLFLPIEAYVKLKGDEDISNSKYDEMGDYLQKIEVEFNKKALFCSLFMKKLNKKHLKTLIADKRFLQYKLYLQDLLEEKSHRLADSVDKFLAGEDFMGENGTIMRKFDNADLVFDDVLDSKGKAHKLDDSTLSLYLESGDRVLRKNTLQTLHGTYGKFINMLSYNYILSVKETCFFAKAHKYSSALQQSMKAEKVDSKVYDVLIKSVRANLPLLFEYFELKRTKLGLKDFHDYDTYVPLNTKNSKKYTYEQAIDLIKKAVAPLGKEYVDLIERAKSGRWIDVMPSKHKRTGAYEIGFYGYHPYVLTNFTGRLDDVFTLAHELGHAMHSHYSNIHQDYEKANYTIFCAEVASTTNEMLLLLYLLKNAQTKAEKEELYNKLFQDVKGTIFRQTMFAEFEEKVHSTHEKGEALSKDKLCQIYFDLTKDYFGKKVKLLDEIKYEWARIPHFFTPFYVYKYASGFLCAINFASKLASGDNLAKEKYISKFLCAGQSKPSVEILKDAGCDLTKQETYDTTFAYLKNMLQEWKCL